MTEAPEPRKLDTVVTSETLMQFQTEPRQQGIPFPPPEIPKEEIKVEETPKPEAVLDEPEEIAEIEKGAAQADKAAAAKGKLSARMHELAETAKSEKSKRESLEKEIEELKAKLAPKPTTPAEDDQKPDRTQFTDAFDYAEKLSEWSARKALRDRDIADAKAKQDAHTAEIATKWNERLNAQRKETPDFDEKMSNSPIVLSNEMVGAIRELDNGPKILLHFVDNPDVAKQISAMTLGKALIALGRLEATLSTPSTPVAEKETAPVVEVSKAPAPITPLKGANAPADLPIDSKGNWTGTLEQYKDARRSGKIQ